MAAHALHISPVASHLKLVVSRPAAVWPAAPVLVVDEPVMSATMKRCLLLAVLLHVWLVLMLGSAPGGTAAPGQGVAGSLNITLQGPETPGARELSAPLPPELAPPEGARGSATLPRWGGVVRDQAAAVPPTPGAAQLGRWSATAQPADAAVPTEAATAPPPLPGRVVEEQAQPAPTAVPADLPALTAEPTAAAVPLVAVPAAPQPERHLAAPAARPLPDLGAALPFAPSPTAVPAVLPGVAPLPVPEAITPRLQRAVRPAAADLPALSPALAPAAPWSQPAPVVPPPLAAVPEAMPAPMAPQAPTQAPTQAPAPPTVQPVASTPQPASIPSALPNVATAGAPSAVPAPAGPARGAPDAGSRLGADVATPPSAAASVPPRLNLQLSRPRGGELSRGSAGGMLPVLPRPPEVDEKLGRDIAKSAKQDCREAYRAAGLLAVLPLAAQALKADGGCKW